MIVDLAEFRNARSRTARLRTTAPYCGPCFDQDGEINDLVPIKLWDAHGRAILGHYCCSCGAEFR